MFYLPTHCGHLRYYAAQRGTMAARELPGGDGKRNMELQSKAHNKDFLKSETMSE